MTEGEWWMRIWQFTPELHSAHHIISCIDNSSSNVHMSSPSKAHTHVYVRIDGFPVSRVHGRTHQSNKMSPAAQMNLTDNKYINRDSNRHGHPTHIGCDVWAAAMLQRNRKMKFVCGQLIEWFLRFFFFWFLFCSISFSVGRAGPMSERNLLSQTMAAATERAAAAACHVRSDFTKSTNWIKLSNHITEQWDTRDASSIREPSVQERIY